MKVTLYIAFFSFLFFSCRNKTAMDIDQITSKIDTLINTQQKSINQILQSKLNSLPDSNSYTQTIQTLYPTNQSYWTNGFQPNEQAAHLIYLLKNSTYYGLESSLFSLDEVQSLYDSAYQHPKDAAYLVPLELALSKQMIRFASANKYGVLRKLNGDSVSIKSKTENLSPQDIQTLQWALKENILSKGLDSLVPKNPMYLPLRKSLETYLKKHDTNKTRVKVIPRSVDSIQSLETSVKALVTYRYLDSAKMQDSNAIISAIQSFQKDHGLTMDGKVGEATAYLMSFSNYDRYQKAAISLERLRHKTIDSSLFFIANIPSFTLRAYENGVIKQEHRVVVGKHDTRTPVFSASMQYLIINPYWAVPYSISSKEILPQIKKNANVIANKGYQIQTSDMKVLDPNSIDWSKVTSKNFNYRIVQVKSGATALGKVKFIFPNDYNIYFHDTPAKSFFLSDVRAYSHGCVRVQDPLQLAAYILSKQDENLTLDSIQKIAISDSQKRFNLKNNIPVEIDYYTSLPDAEGNIQFFRDIYDKDLAYQKALFLNK